MTAKEKALELNETFGKEAAPKVLDELLKRDRQWIEKLNTEYPDSWDLFDINKSIKLYEAVKLEIEKL